MNVVCIDYSAKYYSEVAKAAMPSKRAGKFVQLRNKRTEYLVFAPKEYTPYHADLVERFCTERGIAGSYVGALKRFDIHEPEWVVVGGGKFEIDQTEKYIRFYDNSMAYGKFDSKKLKAKLLKTEGFERYAVLVE